MGEETRLKVALDMLIEYLLQQNQTETANIERPSIGQQCEAHGFGFCTATQLTANTDGSALATGS